MSAKFDESKYRKIFESRFGAGSYNAGLSRAREIGTQSVKAKIAEEEYKMRLKELEKARKEAIKQEEEKVKNSSMYGMPANDAINMIKKAQDQGRGGYRATRENKMKEKKKTDSAKVDYSKLTPYQKQLRGITPSWDKPKPQKEKGFVERFKDFVTSKDVDKDGERDGLLGAIDRFVVPISKGATDSIIPGNTERMAKNNPKNPVVKAAQKDRGLETDVLNAAGMIGAFAAPYSGAYKAANMAVNKVPSLARIANPYAKKAVTGAVAGGMAEAGISATNELANSEANDMRDYAIRTGLAVAGGAVLDPALHGIANLIRKGRGARGAASRPEELLGLPEPQKALPEPQRGLPAPRKANASLEVFQNAFKRPGGLQNPIPEMPTGLSRIMNRNRLEQQGLNFGYNTKNTPKARMNLEPMESPADPLNRGQTYWQKRYEEFANRVNSTNDINNLTPEALEDLWSGFARYDEPVKLDQVVDLAYPKGIDLPAPAKPVEPNIKDSLKADPRVNDLLQRFNALGQPSSAAPKPSFNEMVEQLRQMVPINQAKAQPEGFLNRFDSAMGRTPAAREAAAAVENINPGAQEPTLDRLRNLNRAGKDYEAISPAIEEEPPLLRADDPITDTNFDPKELKDISGMAAANTDIYRIFERVFGDKFETAGRPVIDKLDSAKKYYTDMQEKWANKLKTEVVDKLGIKKGSKESALVQRYGEKNMTLDELKAAAPDKWKDIVKADQWFRQAYDEMYEGVNTARKSAYPDSPDKQVPKLDNYYRHFREMNGLTGLKNIFDSPSQIDPHLAGMSQHTNPSSKWHSFMQKRGMGPYKEDAVGGFLEYIPGASYATNIDPVIPTIKNLRRQLADGTEDSRNINNFIEFLYNYSNDLAGKTNPYFDRNLQQLVGRKTMSVLNWANNRVKKNVILGNIGSTLAQLANIPNGIAFAKQYSVPGAARTLSSVVDKSAPIHKSPFLKERYIGSIYRQFDQKLIEQPEKAAGWLIENADRIGTSFVWNSAYEKGLKQGVADPIRYADDNTRKLIAGRGIGEVPLMQKSKAVQLVMPFTLEVANLWHVMRDFVKAKDFGAIATLFAGSFILNKGMEETRGSAVTFDPIDAIMDAFADEELSGVQKGGRLLGEVLTNVPLGQHLAGLYPEDGKVLNVKGPTREELLGDRNPQRFGTGLVAANGLSDFAFKFALPFGGNQLKKSLNGVEALQDGGEYKKDGAMDVPFLGDKEKLKFPINNTPGNAARALLFGPSATGEAREYYDENRRPLSENQTTEYERAKMMGTDQEYYRALMFQRQLNSIENKIKEIEKDSSLTDEEKANEIQRYYSELEMLQGR